MFGVATASYQVEGGWDADGKGENIWDRMCHTNPDFVVNGDNGDVAADTYHKWEEDMERLQYLGVNHYRLSISWSRILPTGFSNQINQAGLNYYRNLIKALKEYNIEPVVTPPLGLILVTISARCRRELGEDINTGSPSMNPSRPVKEAMVWEGMASIVIDTAWMEPISNRTEDIEAAERRLQFTYGLYANPIVKGNWPQVVIDRVNLRSEGEKFTRTQKLAVTSSNGKDQRIQEVTDPSWNTSAYGWAIVPWGERKLLKWLKDTYDNPKILITENGMSEDGTLFEDDVRISYYQHYLSEILDLIYEDDVNVFGYTAWSFVNTFEWTHGYTVANTLNTRAFPDDFMFGVATAAYQVEGGWDADGKGENIWDNITHKNPTFISTGENGDVACDTYNKWKEDVELLKDLGVNHYRFSISWSRVLPTGLINKINEPGIAYYKNLIKALKENNIEPVVTLYHWDLPQYLQELGGFPNPKIADYFADYARLAFREFGEDVKYWTTFNEPKQICQYSYGSGLLAPGIWTSGVGDYLCVRTVLLAHAKAYHIYDEEFREEQNGLMSIVLDTTWAEPVSNRTEDVEAAERRLQFAFGVFGNPIYNGNWPQVMIDRVGFRSENENFTESRLPEFTDEEIEYIKGTYDFVGLNSYSTELIRDVNEEGFGEPSFDKDLRVQSLTDPSWNTTSYGWAIVPWGLRKVLKWVKDTYNNPKILITENGCSDDGTTLEDEIRIDYYTDYLSAVLDAIYEDEVDVIGYTGWSFMDNFEWTVGYSSTEALSSKPFPDDFMFGVATASYQVEGGWDADGKGENIWDRMCHTNPDFVVNGDNGDVAADTYHKWEEDMERLQYLGVNHYRLSISWSRILPTGFSNQINQAGLNYYRNLIKALKEYNIEPVVTLHHWDFPQSLQDVGGWPNAKLAEYFADYARIVFRELGEDVKYWITFNEPKQTCEGGYGLGRLAPGIKSSTIAEYLCAYTILLSHAKAYHIYDEEFRSTQNGMVSMVIDTAWMEPISNRTEDIEAAERRLQFTYGLYANPIVKGNWPQVVIDRVNLRSEGENFTRSRLPEFTQEQIDYINGTYDFLCINSYTTALVRDIDEAEVGGNPSNGKDQRIQEVTDPSWNTSAYGWAIVPWGERKLLKWLKDTYDNPKILITENGMSDDGTLFEDDVRISYYQDYLTEILDAIYEDEVNVFGYTAWSFVDTFEWAHGYSQHFGFYHVNFTDDSRPRTPKKSVEFYKKLTTTHCLIDESTQTACTCILLYIAESEWEGVLAGEGSTNPVHTYPTHTPYI
ncbi:hypothetical protein NQ317_000462 [Molorchus minor]|uniref:beta-glucosidase n=1 Tax=Molorchus minor TaxID=1323400 RepID=A0ABQ9J7L4_9CUCU|nr:hypothetical protein NQ317_000462 [Molorchus minor]